jgi:gamma-glutamyltranspeptidase/glutathione hydrolase
MHPDATIAALEVMRAGGNAVDAAIATAATVAVASHNWAGVAGDSAWLIHWAETGETVHLDGYSKCPEELDPGDLAKRFGLNQSQAPEAFREEPEGIRDFGIATSMVPGTPAAWHLAWKRFGSQPMDRLLMPAIELAREGMPVSRYLAGSLNKCRDKLGRFPSTRRIFFGAGDKPLGEGEILVQGDLAATLERYARDPAREFADGQTAEAITDYAQADGAALTAKDLAAYQPHWRSAVGIHVLQALNILETFSLADLDYHAADTLHLLIEGIKLALADRRRHAGDPDNVSVDVTALVDKAYAAEQARIIQPAKAVPAAPSGSSMASSTTHFVVCDESGNIVTATQSIGRDFGSGDVAEGTGLVMNDRTWWMSLADGPNVVAPNRRASIGHAPTIVFADDDPWISLGSPGGFGIVQFVVQAIVNVIDYGLDLQSAIEVPRFRIDDLELALSCESRIDARVLEVLRSYGHSVNRLPQWTDRVGGIEGVTRDPRTGNLLGGYDPRRNSFAAGY